MDAQPQPDAASKQDVVQLPDEGLVALARGGDATAFELLMRRHNQRVYRVVRSVLRDGADIEDVMQQAYLSALAHLDQFAGAAQWSTWVCRIAINEALARKRQRSRFANLPEGEDETMADLWPRADLDPERAASSTEFRHLVEEEIDRLPEGTRAVLIMREIEGMSTAETAAILGVADEVVKTRLHRARTSLRERIEARIGEELGEAFGFGNERCDRVVAAVLSIWLEERGAVLPRSPMFRPLP